MKALALPRKPQSRCLLCRRKRLQPHALEVQGLLWFSRVRHIDIPICQKVRP